MGFELGTLGSHSDPLAPSFTVFMYTYMSPKERRTAMIDSIEVLYGSSLFINVREKKTFENAI
jgi:hypothetical protein